MLPGRPRSYEQHNHQAPLNMAKPTIRTCAGCDMGNAQPDEPRRHLGTVLYLDDHTFTALANFRASTYERRSELQLLRKAQEQRSRSDHRARRIHQRELPRHQRRSPDPLALHQPADPNARRTAATFAAGLWHGHSTVAEYTGRSLPERTSVTSTFPNDDDGRKPKVAEL